MTFGSTQYKPKSIVIKISFVLIFFVIALQTTVIMAETVQLPADNFNDNALALDDIWVLNGDDLANVWLHETNQRLEGKSTKQTSEADTANYFSRQWQLSTGHDFSMQIDWHFSSLARNAGVGLIVLDLPSESNVSVEAERDGGISTFCVDPYRNGNEDELHDYDDIPRSVNNGVFYISYDSINDRLYLSINGYRRNENPEAGDWVFENLLKGSWDVDSVTVGVVLWNEDKAVAIASGDAYFDNFQVTQGTVIETTVDNDKDGYTVDQGDCNDNDAAINPGATEICGDGIDQDCNSSDLSCSSDDDGGGGGGGGCFISAIQ